jgi:lipoprotein-anchoring transpeptidase ErfK/SrfK
VKRAALAGLFVVGFALAGGLSATVIADTVPTTTSSTGTTSTGTGPSTTVDSTTAPTTTGPATTTTPTTTSPGAAVIPPGVTVAGVSVGGLTSVAAFGLVQEFFRRPLVLEAGGRTVRAAPTELGATAYIKGALARARAAAPGARIPLEVSVRGGSVREFVAQLSARVDRKPDDARLRLRNLEPVVTRDAPGRRLDRLAAAAVIVRGLRTNERDPLTLPVKRVAAKTTRTGFGAVIVIHRGRNLLRLYHGDRPWRAFAVATGRSAYPTPLGRFEIVVKWRNPWWYPPSSDWARGLDPVPPGPGNPLGTRWLGLSAPGIGIHGTPDDASIGYSASHGCIRMHVPQAEWLFEHVDIGTTVFVVAD